MENSREHHVWERILASLHSISAASTDVNKESTSWQPGRRRTEMKEDADEYLKADSKDNLEENSESNLKSDSNERKEGKLKVKSPCGKTRPNTASVTIVDRISDRLIVVYWCDATLGHYGEQIWTRSTARHATNCVLSGLRVRRGDVVYRPSSRGQRPANFEQVILATMLDGIDVNSI